MPAPTAARPGASCGNDDMTAFRRFDPYAILAKADREQQPLAALAGLAAATTKIENDTEASVISNSSRANKNRNHGGAPAKVANPAKVDEAGTFAPLAALADPTTELEISAQWGEAEEERAAIIECDGKSPRAWAEGFARLNPDHPPGDVPLRRWQRFVDDAGIFLDRWAAYAAALGWGPYDLFGCDRDRPFARLDRAGLLWLLNGDRLIALTENTATIETGTGARQTYRRKPSDPRRVLAWELVE